MVTSFDDAIVGYFHEHRCPTSRSRPASAPLTAWVLDGTPLPDGMRILQLPPDYEGIDVITPTRRRAASGRLRDLGVAQRCDLENYDSYLAFLDSGITGLNINFPLEGVAAVEEFTLSPGAFAASQGCASASGNRRVTTCSISARPTPGTYRASCHLLRRSPPDADGDRPARLGRAAGLARPDHRPHGARRVTPVYHHHPSLTRKVVRWQPWLGGDDVAWFTALLDELAATLCIDTERIYVAGFSNGAMMASVLACELSERIAAIAPVAGLRDPEGCATTRPVPVIASTAPTTGCSPTTAATAPTR